MKRVIAILCSVILCAAAASAELLPANDAGVTVGHLDTNVKDLDAAKKFWSLLGGKPIKIDGVDVMKFPGVLVFLRKGNVTGDTMGTNFDHAGFWVPDGKSLVGKLRSAGVKMDPTAGSRKQEYKGYSWGNVYSPDGVKVEILEDSNLSIPIELDHIHLYGANGVAETDVQAWYHKVFDARLMLDPVPNAGHPVVAGLIANVEFKMTAVTDKLVPMNGRAVEHMGFEIKNLAAYCKKLEANGLKFDNPYSKGASYASAQLTDPWGTTIELTEGLNKF